MARHPKIIPEHVGRRIRELSRIPNTGYRTIAKTIANEFGKDFKYSHVHIGKFLKGENQLPNLPVIPEQPQSTPTYIPSTPTSRKSTMAAWQMSDVPVHHITQSPNPGSISNLDLYPVVNAGSEEADYSYLDQPNPTFPGENSYAFFQPNGHPQQKDFAGMMLDAMNDLSNGIPRLMVETWKQGIFNRYYNNMRARFNPPESPPPPEQKQDQNSAIESLRQKYQEGMAEIAESKRRSEESDRQERERSRQEKERQREELRKQENTRWQETLKNFRDTILGIWGHGKDSNPDTSTTVIDNGPGNIQVPDPNSTKLADPSGLTVGMAPGTAESTPKMPNGEQKSSMKESAEGSRTQSPPASPSPPPAEAATTGTIDPTTPTNPPSEIAKDMQKIPPAEPPTSRDPAGSDKQQQLPADSKCNGNVADHSAVDGTNNQNRQQNPPGQQNIGNRDATGDLGVVTHPPVLPLQQPADTMALLPEHATPPSIPPGLPNQQEKTPAPPVNQSSNSAWTLMSSDGKAWSSSDERNFKVAVVGSVLIAGAIVTEPLWKPKVQELVRWVQQLAPKPQTTTMAQIQTPAPTLYGVPVRRRDIVF